MGGNSQSQTTHTPYEAPNDLISISNIKILDLLCEGQISGFALKSGAYGSDPLCSTYYDEVPVRNLDGSYNFNISGQGYSFDYTLGTQSQGVVGNFTKVENVIPIGSNRVAKPPAGAGLTKYVVANFTTATYPDADSVKVTVRVPSLLSAKDNGDVNGYEIKYAVDISLNNGPFNQMAEETIRGKCTSPYLKEAIYVLPKTTPASSYYSYRVRVRRTTDNILSTKTQNELYVDSITVLSNNSFNYPNSVLVSAEMSAEQFGAIPYRSYEIQGLLINVPKDYVPTTYNPNGTITAAQYPAVWDGTWNSTKRWTDNPAWVFFDLVTNSRYGLGQYIQSGSIDKWALYEISQYCDELVDDGDGGQEPRFTCNVVISERQDAYNLLQNLVSVFRGMMYWGNGRVFTTQTNDKQPIFNYTNANVIDGKFTYADTATNTRSTVAMVKWSDPDNLYREAVEYIEDRDGIAQYGYLTKEITAFACTSKGQAYRIGNWVLQSERLLTETVTFQVGLDGLFVRPGDVFNIYDNYRNNAQQGGRVAKFNSARDTITLDRNINLDDALTYSLTCAVPAATDFTGITSSSNIDLIHPSQVESRQVMTWASGENAVLTVDSAFSANLYAGSVYILSASGDGTVFQKSIPYKCLATSEPSAGIVEILGLQYNTGISNNSEISYSTISNPVNEGDSTPISPPSSLTTQVITGLYSNNLYFRYIQLDWTDTPSTNLAYYVVSGKAFGETSYSVAGKPVAPTYNYSVSTTGLHDFIVLARSKGGVDSTLLTTSLTIPDTNPLANGSNPPTLSGVIITANGDDSYIDSYGYTTGYNYTNPTISWEFPDADNGNPVAGIEFVTGYHLYVQRPSDSFNYLGGAGYINLPNSNTKGYAFPANFFVTGLNSGPQRCIRAFIQVRDQFNTASNGGAIDMNNPAPRAPQASGFYGQRGGLSYSIVPQDIDNDISGAYLWINSSPSFTPLFSAPTLKTTNLAGLAATSLTQTYYTWFSLIDNFGTGGCTIWGPVQVDPVITITSGETLYMVSGASGVLNAKINYISGFLYSGQKEMWSFAVSDEESPLQAGTNKIKFRAPYDATITNVRASLSTAGASTTTFDINNNGTSILSTKLTIDGSETTSVTAAVPVVISNSLVTSDDEFSVDFDTVGGASAGAKINIYVTRTV